ncbi:hypothetical protein OROGR_032762 [Orobanche gracilis]
MEKHYLPRLMMPGVDYDRPYYSRFHSILRNNRSILHIDLKQLYKKRCLGSSHGWLIMAEEESPSIFAVNPLNVSTRIHLPSILTFPDVLDFDGHGYLDLTPSFGPTRVSSRFLMNYYIKKVILSKDPTVGDCMAVAIFGARDKLAVCRVGDNEWDIITDYGGIVGYRDVVFDKEGQYFYAVNDGGTIVTGDPGRARLQLVYKPSSVSDDHAEWKYLALDSKGDNLMLISRHEKKHELTTSGSDEEMEECSDYDDCHDSEEEASCTHYKTSSDEDEEIIEELSDPSPTCTRKRFRVFRLDEEMRELEEIDSLKDEVLFVGDNESLCLSSAEFPGCKSDCVYFTDDRTEARDEPRSGARDIGVFNMKDGCVERFECVESEGSRGIWPPPIWVALTSSMI